MTAGTASEPVVVDSSVWLEYITLDTKANEASRYLEGARPIIVPTIVIYEVYKKLKSSWGKVEADRFASQAMRLQVILLGELLAVAAASISLQHKLAMADAIIYATARSLEAELVTSDQAFAALPGVTLL